MRVTRPTPPQAERRRRGAQLKDLAFGGFAAVLALGWVVAAIRVWPAIAPAATPTTTPRSSADAVVPRLVGRIAIAAGGDVFVIRDGRMSPLATGGDKRDPALSADGSRLAYSLRGTIDGKSVFEGQPVPAHLDYASIVARSTSAGSEETLVNGLQRRDRNGFHAVEFETQPAWSPDGSQVAFISDDGNGADLKILTIASKRVASLSGGKVFADPAWSPDGKTIAVSNYTGGEKGTIRLVPADGRIAARTLRLARDGDAYRPSYSPDGTWLLVTLRTDRGNDLVAVELATERVVDLSTDGKSWGGVFAPDGALVAFLREQGGLIDLFVLEVGETLGTGATPRAAQQVTRDGRLDGTSRPSWTR